MLPILALLPIAASAEDCFYRDAREGHVAVQTDGGFAILAGDDGLFENETGGYDEVKAGQVIDRCTDEPGDVTRYSRCEGGWEGVLFFGGLSADDPFGDDLMVLQNSIWYRECPATKDGGI